MFIGVAVVAAVGIVCAVLGLLLWKKEKIGLLHEYHYDKVADADKPAFCTLSGIGMLVIGTGLLATAVLLAVTDHPASFLAFAAGFAAGLGLLIYAGKKYNVS